MKTLNRSLVGTAALAAVATGVLALGLEAASAATNPPYEPTAQSVGTLTFYDAAGNVVTSGKSTDTPFAAYAVGSVKPRATDNQSGLFYANPDPNSPPLNWYAENAGSFTANPLTSGPTNLQTASATQPVYRASSGDQTLDGFEQDSTISTTPGYANIVNVRLVTALGSNVSQTYDDADLMIDPVKHTWTQIYPAPKTVTTTTLTASPNPAVQNTSVTLSAQESPAVAGSVQFKNGSTNLGAAVAVDSSGKASTTATFATTGNQSLSAVFTPTDTTANSGSTGTTTLNVVAPATPTSTSLAVTQDGTAGDPATLAATVTSGGNGITAGSVSFYDNGSTTALGTVQGSSATSGGVYTLNLPNGFGSGTHSVVAKFTPSDPTQYNPSQSSAQTFLTQAPVQGACTDAKSVCTDPQNIQVTVPVGTIVINTPYTSSNPLDLGTMALNSTGTEFTANAPFQHIKVTDTRSGGNGYTVSAISSDLSDGKKNAGSTIDAQNVGLTNLSATESAGYAGTVVGTDNAAADPAVAPGAAGSQGLGTTPHTVFTTTNSDGTVDVSGKLTVNAPTSTEAGLFTGVITFTVG